MSQSAQIEISADHVVAYLDTVLHGDHARFREAFNRAEGPRTVSDANAYVDEELEPAMFIRWTSTTVSHNASSAINGTENLTVTLEWTLRDGTTYAELPPGWDVNLTCGWSNGPWEASGSLGVNGSATCVYPHVTRCARASESLASAGSRRRTVHVWHRGFEGQHADHPRFTQTRGLRSSAQFAHG